MLVAYLLFVTTLLYEAAICNAKKVCYKKCECLGTYVDCSKTMVNAFPEALPQWMETLDLSLNKIDGNLTIDTNSYLHLTTLKLTKNSISYFPVFVNKSNISHLNLAHNKIEKLEALENLPNLKTLDMNKNKLIFLDDNTFSQSKHFKILNLNNNFITNLSANCFDALTNLVELKISHNKLNNLPIGLFKKLKNLELLDLSRNHITVIHGLLFMDLVNLKSMILRQNQIEDLQDGSFFGLINLQSLHLEDNNLSKISKGWLYGLNSLVYLNISYNRLDQIKSGWEYCAELEELDLSYNKLQYIEKSNLENLRKLQKLHLNNNRLSFIEEGSFNNTPMLQILQMDHNYLSWLIEDAKETFIGLRNLKKLSLANNKILFIKKEAFSGLDNLDELNLLQNNVLEIQDEAFKYMPNLEYLYLNSSSLVCDCSMSWLKQPNIFEDLPFDYINAFCGFPEKNKGKNLKEISFTDFSCLENSPKPMIVFHPESKMVLERQNITLKCGVNSSSTEKINFVWKKDNHDLESISTNHYSSFEFNGMTQFSVLNLYNISMSQSGKYQCVASNEFGITYSNRSVLSVVVYPFFAKVPGNSSVKTGLTAKLECAANGYPAPQISWQKDGGTDFPAAQERRMKVMARDDVFLIVDVKLVDMGIYSCTAKNVAGMIAANATLNVLEPPWFKTEMSNKQVRVGEEVVLECLSYGSPKPKIKWTKDGIILTLSNRHFFTAENQLLVIMEANTDDSGTYQCEITNSLGVNSQKVDVLVMPLYRSLIHEYTLGLVIIVIIMCIIIIIAIWVLFVYKAKRPSSNLINNADNKSLDSSNSKDSGTGESTKRSQEQLFNECLSTGQKLNNNVGNLSPEINLPLLTHASVVLGENSVTYKNSKTAIQLPTAKPNETVEDQTTKCDKSSERPCSKPTPLPNETQNSPPIAQQSSSHASFHEPSIEVC
ncbi:leucine-rich repeats and immunoglobulin-like domains protein 3 isoform X2 [Melanaphis sacchari]|uniref:leucine-rich repeats and immunoglobulin-like domains protein 3 isoform X2 n=1 Tax=Melanaphis sacchari TaxID=742174 RepID=UPI000DC146D3|nr:leucine-rich repeats and immunoglobulin-like domains protein 3 isoform X2 [Melanaphis sacchari]